MPFKTPVAPNGSGISFGEMPGSPTKKFASGGMTAQRVLLCAYADEDDFLIDFLGQPYIDANGALQRYLPLKYPGVLVTPTATQPAIVWTDGDNPYGDLYATSADVEYVGKPTEDLPNNQNAYDQVKATIGFESVPYYVNSNPTVPAGGVSDILNDGTLCFTEIKGSFGGSDALIKGKFFQWHNVPVKALDVDLPIRVPDGNIHFIRHQVPNLPITAMKISLGTLNGVLANYDSSNGGTGAVNLGGKFAGLFPINTLRLLSAEWEAEFTATGFLTWKITYTCSYRFAANAAAPLPAGGLLPSQNNFLRADATAANWQTPAFDQVDMVANAAKQVFAATDWTNLWA